MTKEEDGIEIKVERDGTRLWYLHGVLHWDDGPRVTAGGISSEKSLARMVRPLNDRMARKSGFGMGSITAKTAQLLSAPRGAQTDITFMEKNGRTELRSSRGGK